MGCDTESGDSENVASVAIACNLTGNGLTLVVFTVYDLRRLLRSDAVETEHSAVITAALRRRRRHNAGCCSASIRQQKERQKHIRTASTVGTAESTEEHQLLQVLPMQNPGPAILKNNAATTSWPHMKTLARTTSAMWRFTRAISDQRAKLTQAVVFYSVTWLCVCCSDCDSIFCCSSSCLLVKTNSLKLPRQANH